MSKHQQLQNFADPTGNLCAMAKVYCDNLATAMAVSDNETKLNMIHTSDLTTSSRDGSYDSDVETDLVDLSNAEDSSAAEHVSPSLTPHADASMV